MNAENLLWTIFVCKVGQSVLIGMRLELHVWHDQLNAYTKFQTDTSKHVEKSNMCKNNCQNSEKRIFARILLSCRKVYSGPPMYQIWKSNSTCHATYCICIPSFKLISRSMLRLCGWTDIWTDWHMDEHCHGIIICLFFKREYKKQQGVRHIYSSKETFLKCFSHKKQYQKLYIKTESRYISVE